MLREQKNTHAEQNWSLLLITAVDYLQALDYTCASLAHVILVSFHPSPPPPFFQIFLRKSGKLNIAIHSQCELYWRPLDGRGETASFANQIVHGRQVTGK